MVKFFQSASIEAITKDTPIEETAVNANHVMIVKEKEYDKRTVTVVILSNGQVMFSPDSKEDVLKNFYNFSVCLK